VAPASGASNSRSASSSGQAAGSQAMTKTLIKIALTLSLGLSSAPAFAGGYVVNGHSASAAEMQFLASYGVQPGS